jgi:RNA recognition motif-containing protein
MAFKNDGDSYSRVFILGARDLNEDTLREEFEKYGTVKDVYFVKDRHTNERKGQFRRHFCVFVNVWAVVSAL